MRLAKRPAVIVGVVVGALLGTAAAARADVVTLGSPLVGEFAPERCSPGPCSVAQNGLPGATLRSPVDGVVIRWRIVGGDPGSPYGLRVLRPLGATALLGAGSSVAHPAGSGLETFPADLPIHAGDLIGIDLAAEAHLGIRDDAASSYLFSEPAVADGVPTAVEQFGGADGGLEVALNADVLPAPTITALGASSGSIAGGTAVSIAGTDFQEVRGVSFGGVAASSFHVDSETGITAIAPPRAALGPVAVAVTTPAGSATSPQPFSYAGCVVPALRGTRLAGSKRALAAAGCGLGAVAKRRGVQPRSARVVGQQPAAGTVLAPGAEVGLKLGAPRPHKHRPGPGPRTHR